MDENSYYLSDTPTTKRYTESFKISVVKEVEKGYINKEQAKRKYNIGGNTTILRWCRKYGKDSLPMKRIMYVNEKPELNDIEKLKQKLTELEAENKLLRMQNHALEAVIDVSSEIYDTDLKKKFGPKL